jgi:hypothetical protein
MVKVVVASSDLARSMRRSRRYWVSVARCASLNFRAMVPGDVLPLHVGVDSWLARFVAFDLSECVMFHDGCHGWRFPA